MQFKKIDINGFKSFFDKTTFFIEDGLTGVVGPNGCGKSNIVEALRWCMGETSAKSMRGSGMEDVIFAGTSNRPAKNITEVSVYLANDKKNQLNQYKDFDEIVVTRRIEKDKGSKYYINKKEVRAKDAQTLFADLSTGAHSPSLISQGRIGQLVTQKPAERRVILEEAAGISGIHARRDEAESRLQAAENNLKRADDLRKQKQKQLDNLKKQAEEATRYKEISKEIKKIEAGLYFLKIQEIDLEKTSLKDKINEQEDDLSAVKIDLTHNNNLLSDEDKKIAPLRDRKLENLAKIQKINLDLNNLQDEEKRVKDLRVKLQKDLDLIYSDLEREKSIGLDASLNEKRLLEEKDTILKSEKDLFDIEKKSNEKLNLSKDNLYTHKEDFKNLFARLESISNTEPKIKMFEEVIRRLDNSIQYIDQNKPQNAKEEINTLKEVALSEIDSLKVILEQNYKSQFDQFIDKLTSLQERYATDFSDSQTIQKDSIKRKERFKNIDNELENWKNLKINSEKMTSELQNRQEKIRNDIDDNQQIPEKLAQSKGQNLQNLENLNKENQELEEQISAGETKLNEIKKNLNEVQEKYSLLRENRARLEATIEGIEKRKSDLVFNLKNDLRIEDTKNLINHTDLAMEQLPSISEQEEKLENINKQREALGSVNLRADEETKNIQGEIEKMESDRADLVTAIIKLKSSISELNEKGRERIVDAFEKVNKKFSEVYAKLFNGGTAKLDFVDSDDPLEAGLELLVSPPGKKLQSITLLSGGEQALTALSLIFAVFLVNPSPICVLDEVDAPLDDANVTRFCNLLAQIKDITKTRFIIITHHAYTMSKMQRLYGVTMPEKGVSQLVAVDLERAEGLVA
jgi:chromosome segregation protein